MLKEVRESLYIKEDKTKLSILLNVLIVLVIAVLVAEIYFLANYSGVYVDGDSMEPTLIDGDYVYIDKHAKPDYGDIVVIYIDSENKYLIKRAVAFGGDRVKLVEGQLLIRYRGKTDFEPVPEDYLSDDYNNKNLPYNTFANDEFGYLVQEGHVFLLGDNRDISHDSRKLESQPLKNLDGVVTKWSLKHKSFCTKIYKFFNF